MDLRAFDYYLPPDLIAQFPSEKRTASRLLCLNRKTGQIQHQVFEELSSYLKAGDALVLNNTKVMRARLFGKKKTGGIVEIVLLQKKESLCWQALLSPSARLKGKVELTLSDNTTRVIVSAEGGNRRVWFDGTEDVELILERCGHMPLPPYIAREDSAIDHERYQTVFAKETGAIAAPTAGLHFDVALLNRLQQQGVQIVYVTLHVGYGTFKPIRCEDIKQHQMHEEHMEVKSSEAQQLNEVKAKGGRVFACGTTALRALETAAKLSLPLEGGGKEGVTEIHPPLTPPIEGGEIRVKPFCGSTNLYVTQPSQLRFTDGLITNFHLPKTSLFVLVCAFGGYTQMVKAYEEAIAKKYRFYSYGDAMLIYR